MRVTVLTEMKRKLSILLAAVLMMSAVSLHAFAFDWNMQNVQPGTATKTDEKTKTGKTGSAASIVISVQTNKWIYRIRKPSGAFVSRQLRFPPTNGIYPLAYEKDGYGHSLGRKGYDYRLNVAFYSKAVGTGTSMGTFIP